MTGQEFRTVLKRNDFFLSDFAMFVGKSRWWAQRISPRQRQVAPRWVVKLNEFLQAHGLNLSDFYPKFVFDDASIGQQSQRPVPEPLGESIWI